MVKNMLFVGPEGETLDLDGSVVDKEKAMKENPRKRKEKPYRFSCIVQVFLLPRIPGVPYYFENIPYRQLQPCNFHEESCVSETVFCR
jgi:hypothetical protein